MTNIEKIQQYVEQNGDNSVLIHPIPRTQLWLVGRQQSKNQWRIRICNPYHTKAWLVTKAATEENYFKLWRTLTLLHNIPAKPAEAATTYKKTAESYKKHHKII